MIITSVPIKDLSLYVCLSLCPSIRRLSAVGLSLCSCLSVCLSPSIRLIGQDLGDLRDKNTTRTPTKRSTRSSATAEKQRVSYPHGGGG